MLKRKWNETISTELQHSIIENSFTISYNLVTKERGSLVSLLPDDVISGGMTSRATGLLSQCNFGVAQGSVAKKSVPCFPTDILLAL